MDVSVILTTYNQPDWLEKVVWGYAAQLHKAFEIVVADDGSTPETAALISRLRRETGIHIQHAWHRDQGFRKCRILNQAILKADSSYLVFSDGDCIPRKDFLSAHVRHAAPGRFLSGGVVRLPSDLSDQIKIGDIQDQRTTDLSWLCKRGLSLNKKCLMLTRSHWKARILDHLTTTRATWNGHNASGWKEDLVQVNGFDERMGYGGEDRELGQRLMNIGIRPLQIRHRAVCVHLEHKRGYIDEELVQWNIQHRKTVRREQVTWTNHGIVDSQEESRDCVVLKFPVNSGELSDADAKQNSEVTLEETILRFPSSDKPQSRRAA